MNLNPDQFEVALAKDVKYVYKEGLDPEIEAESIPAFAELAESLSASTNSGDKEYYGDVVASSLHDAIARFRLNKEREGLIALFGIGKTRQRKLGVRRQEAAKALGYQDGETFRQGERDKRPVADVILDEVGSQLLALATERGFVYAAKYVKPTPPVDGGEQDDSGLDPVASVGSPTAPPAEPPPAPSTSNLDESTSRRRRLGWRRSLGSAIVAAVVLGAATLVIVDAPASHQKSLGGWGPTRLVYDYERYNGNNNCDDPTNPATYYGRCGAITTFPVFNSFINTPEYGDERAFFDGYGLERANGDAGDPVRNVINGNKIVVLRIYIDNMAQVDEKEPEVTTAYNTRVRVALPTSASDNLLAYAYISADRAVTVYDSVDLTGRRSFSLEYVPSSALLLRGHKSYPLSDEIIGSEGALIGVNTMNGVLPPSTDFSGTLVELKVRAVPQASQS